MGAGLRLGAVPWGDGAIPLHSAFCQETFPSSGEAPSRPGGLTGGQAAGPGMQTEWFVCGPGPGRQRPPSPPGTAAFSSSAAPSARAGAAAQRPACARCTHPALSQHQGRGTPPWVMGTEGG